LLGDGEKKCSEVADTRTLYKYQMHLTSGLTSRRNSKQFRFHVRERGSHARQSSSRPSLKESTCYFFWLQGQANLELKWSAHTNKRSVPHPLFAKFELRVQTDGDITPKEALVNTCKNIVSDLATLSREFTKEYELRKMVSGGGATVNGNANGNN
jgi:DNA-directed RNA polymerase II subunit RPB11